MDKKTENLVKAMTYGSPDEIPVFAGFLPTAWLKYGDKLKKLQEKYPDVIGNAMPYDESNMPERFYNGRYTDGWGCVWSNTIEGMEAIVTGHPVKTREDILTLKLPTVDMGLPHGFMYLRLLDLRGFEEAMIDFAEEAEELDILIEKVLSYNMDQIRKQLKGYNSPVMMFGDDLGMQTGLAIGREKWVKYLKPCYKKMYDLCHEAGVLVYMHTDGHILEIMPDLQETGVDMINPQFRANGLDNLVRVCKGKIPICLDLDRQLFPFATPKQLRTHVKEAVEKMYLKEGGLAINLEFGAEVPLENIEAVVDAMNEYRFYK